MIPRSSASPLTQVHVFVGDFEHEESPARGLRGACARDHSSRGPAEDRQDRLHQHLQRAGRRHRQRYAEFLRSSVSIISAASSAACRSRSLRGRPDQARRRRAETQKLIESDKVDFVVGYIWSNVLLASLKPLVDSKTVTVVTNAGASQLAGELCSPYVFSTSWQNDQTRRRSAST